jgi:hypothetical protein
MHRAIELYLNGLFASADLDLPEMGLFRQWLLREVVPRGWAPYRTEWSIFDEEAFCTQRRFR